MHTGCSHNLNLLAYDWAGDASSCLCGTDLDQIVEPLRATCTTKVKANSVKQEFEKQDELKRSAMRAVAALLQIPDAGLIFAVFHSCLYFCGHPVE